MKRPSDSIKQLAMDTVRLAENMPKNVNLKLEYPTEEGLKTALAVIEPVKWQIYGPYFEQLDQPVNSDYPSPHGEGCVLPDIVCMVNNQVFLEKDYKKEKIAYTIEAYDDFIDVDNYIKMEGQYACFADTTVVSKEDKKVWLIVGNNDGFSISVNGEEVLKKDEMRLWTPYNNFCL